MAASNREAIRRQRVARQARAAQLQIWLFNTLGNRCALCGTDIELTVDHVDGITWDRNGRNAADRIYKYVAELKEGVRLRLLCNPCNGLDGRMRQNDEVIVEVGEDVDEVGGGEPGGEDAPF